MDWRFAYLLAKLRTKKWEIPLASSLQTLNLRLYDSSKSLVFVGKQMPEKCRAESETRLGSTLR